MGRQAAPGVDLTYCIVHVVIKGLVLGKETTGSIWRVRQLGAMDEVVHRGTSTPSTSSNSAARGVPVREVKVPLAVVTVALKYKRVKHCKKIKVKLHPGLAAL